MDQRFVLRRAEPSDANALAQFYRRVFYETFVEDFSIPYPEEDLQCYYQSSSTPESFTKNLTNSRQAIWLIEDRNTNELMAFALVGPCHSDDIPHPDVRSNDDGFINRLYVQRDRQSHGFGRQLMDVILPWLEQFYPQKAIWLSVWSKNVKAQRFYQHYGFEKVGEFQYRVGEWQDEEFIMKREPIPLIRLLQ